jgi:predicted DNA-binding WGR domain protein
MRRFELSDGTSNKFWEIDLDGKSFTVRFGKIGTNGQTQVKSFPTPAKAQAEHDKLVREKTGKGYAEVGAAAATAAAAPAASAKSAPAKGKAKSAAKVAKRADGDAAEADAPAAVADGALVIKGYKVVLDNALEYKIINPAGNVLASVPDAVRKSPEWQQLVALRENHRNRLKENTRTIEGWMLARRAMSTARLAPLFGDPAWAKPLGALLVQSGDVRGFVVGGDPQKGLGLMGKDLDTSWVKRDHWHIPHPLDLKDLGTWQQVAADNGLAQGVLQLMRPIHRALGKEGTEKSSDRFAKREFASTIQLSYAFNARAWAAARGTASRTFELLEGDAVIRVTAEFEYAADMEDYGDMNGECTTGDLAFYAVTPEGNGKDDDDDDDFGYARYYRKDKALLLKDVPASIFSEACFDIDAVLSSIRK